MTYEDYQRYKELGNLLNNGADVTDAELEEFKRLEKELYTPVRTGDECPNGGRYIK